jgi:hypothetical protein
VLLENGEPEVHRHSRNEFGTLPPTRVTITKIHDKFEVDGAVQNVTKGRSRRPRSSSHYESIATVLQAYTHNLQGIL